MGLHRAAVMATAWEILKEHAVLQSGTAWQLLNSIQPSVGQLFVDYACGVEVEMSVLDLGGEMGAISTQTTLASVKANPVLEAIDNQLETVFPPVDVPQGMMATEQGVYILDENGNPIIFE